MEVVYYACLWGRRAVQCSEGFAGEAYNVLKSTMLAMTRISGPTTCPTVIRVLTPSCVTAHPQAMAMSFARAWMDSLETIAVHALLVCMAPVATWFATR